MGVERRDFIRFSSDAKITISSADSASASVDAYMVDCSRIGAKIVSPVYFDPKQSVNIEVEMLGGALEINGKVVGCKEDPKQLFRFERTFVVNVQFDPLPDTAWNDLMCFAKQI